MRVPYIHTGSGIFVVNNVTTWAKYKQITDKLRSADSRLAPLRLIRSVMDLYLFLRAFLPTLHECTLKAVPCQLVGNCLYTAFFLTAPCSWRWILLAPYLQKQPRCVLSPRSSFRHFFILTIWLWRNRVTKPGQNPARKKGREPGFTCPCECQNLGIIWVACLCERGDTSYNFVILKLVQSRVDRFHCLHHIWYRMRGLSKKMVIWWYWQKIVVSLVG